MRLYRQISSAAVGHSTSAKRPTASARRAASHSGPGRPRAASGVKCSSIVMGKACYPTLPSMLSSMSRESSTAYSMGSVLVIGSMNPLTIIAVACCSERPRLIR